MWLVILGFSLMPLMGIASDLKRCDPENEEGFLEFCNNSVNRTKKDIHKIPLWQGTDYPGYQLINCQKGTIKNVIEKTGESYSCRVPVENNTYKKAQPLCDPMIEVSFIDYCGLPENNLKLGYQLVQNKDDSKNFGRKLIDCQNGLVKMIGKSGDDFSCKIPKRSIKTSVHEETKK